MQNLNVNYFPPGATLKDEAIVHLPPVRTDTGTWGGEKMDTIVVSIFLVLCLERFAKATLMVSGRSMGFKC